jgi:hypothetical protein
MVQQDCMLSYHTVTALKLASANPVESLAIHPFKPTCDQTRNHLYKTIRVNARQGELSHYNSSSKNMDPLYSKDNIVIIRKA